MSKRSASEGTKLIGGARSVSRVVLAVVAAVTIAVIVVVAYRWPQLRRANTPNVRTNLVMLGSAAQNLLLDGFAGCPTVQQVIALTREPARSELLLDTNGLDPWGSAYRIECDEDKLRVFTIGAYTKAGTADDIRSSRMDIQVKK